MYHKATLAMQIAACQCCPAESVLSACAGGGWGGRPSSARASSTSSTSLALGRAPGSCRIQRRQRSSTPCGHSPGTLRRGTRISVFARRVTAKQRVRKCESCALGRSVETAEHMPEWRQIVPLRGLAADDLVHHHAKAASAQSPPLHLFRKVCKLRLHAFSHL